MNIFTTSVQPDLRAFEGGGVQKKKKKNTTENKERKEKVSWALKKKKKTNWEWKVQNLSYAIAAVFKNVALSWVARFLASTMIMSS